MAGRKSRLAAIASPPGQRNASDRGHLGPGTRGKGHAHSNLAAGGGKPGTTRAGLRNEPAQSAGTTGIVYRFFRNPNRDAPGAAPTTLASLASAPPQVRRDIQPSGATHIHFTPCHTLALTSIPS